MLNALSSPVAIMLRTWDSEQPQRSASVFTEYGLVSLTLAPLWAGSARPPHALHAFGFFLQGVVMRLARP